MSAITPTIQCILPQIFSFQAGSVGIGGFLVEQRAHWLNQSGDVRYQKILMRVRKHLISIQIVSKLAQKMMPLGKCLPSDSRSRSAWTDFHFLSPHSDGRSAPWPSPLFVLPPRRVPCEMLYASHPTQTSYKYLGHYIEEIKDSFTNGSH